MKKSYTATFKAQVVLELLKETTTISQRAAQYELHPNVLRAWRDQAVKELPAVFEKHDSLVAVQAAHAKHLEERSAELGRRTTHVPFLKNRVPSCAIPNGARWSIPPRTRCRARRRLPCSASVGAAGTLSPYRHPLRRWRSRSTARHTPPRTRSLARAS